MSDELREMLRGLVREALAEGNGNGDGGASAGGSSAGGAAPPAPDVVPQIPAPPVAAVLRPSTWSGPPAAGEVIGSGDPAEVAPPGQAAPAEEPAAAGPGVTVETVTIDTDADLDRFVRALAGRIDNPRDRMAIRAGKLRFALRRTPAAGSDGTPAHRVDQGAVTERSVRAAADAGARLVLGRRAVLTPLARDRARALGVEIERER